MDDDQVDKMDDFMLPGFRFHPTDEELVGFYLKKKIQHRPLPIELIKQVDIYKYDPWDLPNLAPSGEKEWYFYCPRDRKYKNSARPNRVTGAGFWKATGTDRPIYSSDGTKCIGLKKSLVFYKGRAAKGMKTDWMMHEFRLPSPADQPAKKIVDKSIPPNDAWAICRIFKKTNSMAHRVISQSWVSSLNHDKTPDFLAQSNQFSTPDNISCMMDQICYSDNLKPASGDGVLALEIQSHRPVYQTACKTSPFPLPFTDFPGGFMFSSADTPEPTTNPTPDVASLFNLGDHASNTCESIGFGGEQQQPFDNFSMTHSHDPELGDLRTCGFQFGLPSTAAADGLKGNMPWESPTCPSEMSATYSTNRCHT